MVSKMAQNPALGVFSDAFAAMLKEIVEEAVREAMSQNEHGNKELPTTATPRPYLTVKEAADMARLSPSAIRLHVSKRQLKALHVGSRVIIKRTDLERFLEGHPIEALPD